MRSNRFSRATLTPLALAILVAGAGLGGITGCGEKNPSANLIPSANSPIADVPVPAGFKMINDESTSKVVVATSTRFVDHMYKGSDDYLPVTRFYRDQMPAKGWTFIEQLQVHDEITLRFKKASEDCNITISPKKLLKNTRIRIQIDMASAAAPAK